MADTIVKRKGETPIRMGLFSPAARDMWGAS